MPSPKTPPLSIDPLPLPRSSNPKPIPKTNAAWELSAFLAAARGEFFHSLLLTRLHLDDEQQRRVLQTILPYFLAPPSDHTAPWEPSTPPLSLQIPPSPSAQLALAFQLIRDLKGVKLTAALPKPT